LAFSEVQFDTREGLSRKEALRLGEAIIQNKTLFKKDLWEGYGYRLYREKPEKGAALP
jgi:hypothetical protein